MTLGVFSFQVYSLPGVRGLLGFPGHLSVDSFLMASLMLPKKPVGFPVNPSAWNTLAPPFWKPKIYQGWLRTGNLVVDYSWGFVCHPFEEYVQVELDHRKKIPKVSLFNNH